MLLYTSLAFKATLSDVPSHHYSNQYLHIHKHKYTVGVTYWCSQTLQGLLTALIVYILTVLFHCSILLITIQQKTQQTFGSISALLPYI